MTLQEIIKTDNIIRIGPDDTLSHALGKLASSHDAAFVVDKDDVLLGVINPYYALIHSSYPGNAKVSHCMTMPPKLTTRNNIVDAIRLMSESKIHYLPVIDDMKKFIGIVSARRILSSMADSPAFKVSIETFQLAKKPFVNIDEGESVSKAIHMFKDKKISKLVVTNGDNKLKGVLAYYDLISYLAVPKERPSSGNRKGEKAPFLSYKVKNFMKSLILTLTPMSKVSEAVKMILDKKIGSVVIVDPQGHPIGIITTKDILGLLHKQGSGLNLEIVHKNLSNVSKRIVSSFTHGFFSTVAKKKDLEKATLVIKEEKGGGLFEVLFAGFFKRGQKEIIKKEGRDLGEVLTEVKKTLKEDGE